MPNYIYSGGTTEYNGKIYIIAGVNKDHTFAISTYAYDPSTDTYEQKANMPSTIRNGIAGVVKDKIYYGGGNRGSLINNRFFEYDPARNVWTELSTMIGAGGQLVGGAIGDKFYLLGEESEVFDTVSRSWSSLGVSVPTGGGSCVYDNKIYVFGNNVQCGYFDPTDNSYTQISNPPYNNLTLIRCTVLNDMIHVIGGYSTSGYKNKDYHYAYDPKEDTWHIKKPFIDEVRGLMVSTLNGRIFAFGGQREEGVVLNSAYMYVL